MNKENKPKFTSEEMTNFNVDAVFNALNKENIEPKKIHSTRELISRMYTNSANLKHIAETGTINGSLLQEIERVMNEYANQFRGVTESPTQPPAISSNEGETVENAVQKVLDYLHENITASIVYEDFYDFSKGIKGADVDYFPESTQELITEMGIQWQAGQSQHSYTEADLKAAWQAGNDFGNECHCGECEYCIDVKYGEAQPFDVWLKTYPKQVTPIYSTDEVLAIIEQVKKTCAYRANTEIYDSNNIVDKQSITDIDFKYLLDK